MGFYVKDFEENNECIPFWNMAVTLAVEKVNTLQMHCIYVLFFFLKIQAGSKLRKHLITSCFCSFTQKGSHGTTHCRVHWLSNTLGQFKWQNTAVQSEPGLKMIKCLEAGHVHFLCHSCKARKWNVFLKKAPLHRLHTEICAWSKSPHWECLSRPDLK